jgi:hypothetical protein
VDEHVPNRTSFEESDDIFGPDRYSLESDSYVVSSIRQYDHIVKSVSRQDSGQSFQVFPKKVFGDIQYGPLASRKFLFIYRSGSSFCDMNDLARGQFLEPPVLSP